MSRYACKGLGCPERAPVAADAPPTCYTCGQPMALHRWEVQYDAIQRPIRTHSVSLASLRELREHPATSRMRRACLDWEKRVRAAAPGTVLYCDGI